MPSPYIKVHIDLRYPGKRGRAHPMLKGVPIRKSIARYAVGGRYYCHYHFLSSSLAVLHSSSFATLRFRASMSFLIFRFSHNFNFHTSYNES
jgi:hypothetical protein